MNIREQGILLPAQSGAGRARLALVVAIVLTVGAGFLYVAGWLSPQRLTPGRIVDTFERVNGPHPGFRRNHAKGVSISGYFEANGVDVGTLTIDHIEGEATGIARTINFDPLVLPNGISGSLHSANIGCWSPSTDRWAF